MAEKSEFQRTAGSAMLISATAFGGAIIGFFLQLLVAYYFGASSKTDAFFMAQSTSDILSKLLLGGSITSLFIPVFVGYLSSGKREEAWDAALNVLHVSMAAYISLLVIVAIFSKQLITFIAPGFDAATQALTTQLLRILLPSFALFFLVDLLTSILYSFKRFAIPAVVRILAPTGTIIAILLFAHQLNIYALAIGTVFSSILQVLFLFYALSREKLPYRFIFQPQAPVIRRMLHLIYPFVISVVLTQASAIVYRVLVSRLATGSLASLKFAEKITQFLAILFLASVTDVIYPVLSEKASKKDYVGMRDTIGSAIRLICLVTIPVVVGVVTLREPLIAFIYQRGSFTAEAAHATSLALLYLVLGLTINGISSVFGYTVLALQQTRASVAISTATQFIAIFLFVMLVPLMAHAGLALASSLVPISIALLYFLYLTRFIPQLQQVWWSVTYLKIAVLAVIMGFILHVLRFPALPLLAQLVIPTVVGAAVFFGGAYAMRIPEMTEVAELFQRRLSKLPFFKKTA